MREQHVAIPDSPGPNRAGGASRVVRRRDLNVMGNSGCTTNRFGSGPERLCDKQAIDRPDRKDAPVRIPTKLVLSLATAGVLATGLAACGSSSSSASSSSSTSSAAAAKPLATLPALTGNYTQVTLDASFVKALGTLGLTPGTIGTVKADLAAGTLQFPITGGSATYYAPGSRTPYVESNIEHQGSGFSLAAGGKTVGLENFVVDAGASKLYGDVTLNGKVVAPHAYLFFLDGRTLKPLDTTTEPGNGILEGTEVKISPDAATLLNSTFGTTAVQPYTLVGVAKIDLKVK